MSLLWFFVCLRKQNGNRITKAVLQKGTFSYLQDI
jgi:hypothetical protein